VSTAVDRLDGVSDERHHISGAHVPVRLGLGLAICGAFAAILLAADIVMGIDAWHRWLFLAVAVVLSAIAAWTGIWGVIRYGLFTEGCGAGEVERELHLSRIAYAAGGIAQVTLLVTVVLVVVLLVRL